MHSVTTVDTFHGAEVSEEVYVYRPQVTTVSSFPEAPTEEGSALRGAITGMLLGAGMWAAMIYGVVRIFKL